MHSNIYLVLVGFDEYMHQEHGSITRVPRRRTVRSNCMDDFGLFPERVNLHTYERDWYRRYSGNICRMNTQVRYKPFEKSSLDWVTNKCIFYLVIQYGLTKNNKYDILINIDFEARLNSDTLLIWWEDNFKHKNTY